MRSSHLCLTPIHFSTYEFIVNFKKAHDGVAPTFSEIGKACGISSTSEVKRHLDRLVLFGMIECDYGKGKSRMITVPGARWVPPSNGNSSSPVSWAEHVELVSGSSIKS
jgi:SOS-response transcriptional repressor LexA